MSEQMVEQKKALRAMARAKIKAISRPDQAKGAAAACELLNPQEIWKQAKVVLMYWPLVGEVDLRPMLMEAIEQKKIALLPRYAPERDCYVAASIRSEADLMEGPFGIMEPAPSANEEPLSSVELALIPGLAFDRRGGRLGRGRGFYDRLLAEAPGAKCGVAFDEQIFPALPVESHDVRMDFLLTPSQFSPTTFK